MSSKLLTMLSVTFMSILNSEHLGYTSPFTEDNYSRDWELRDEHTIVLDNKLEDLSMMTPFEKIVYQTTKNLGNNLAENLSEDQSVIRLKVYGGIRKMKNYFSNKRDYKVRQK